MGLWSHRRRPTTRLPISKAGAELLFDVIATAYERYSLVVTTNLPFENWTEVLGSEPLTGATLDRLTHRCHILETKEESYQLQDATQRRQPGSRRLGAGVIDPDVAAKEHDGLP